MYGALPPLRYIFTMCCITTHCTFELLPGALDEIIRIMSLAEVLHFKFDDDDDDDDSVHVY